MAKSKSGLFLMELIIAIAFFSVSSAICIQLFALAHTLTASSVNMQMAVINAQSAAETFKVAGDDVDYLRQLLQADIVDGNVVANFDEDWNRISAAEEVRYRLLINSDVVSNMATAVITISDFMDGSEVYSLTVHKYLGL
ncbi:MAG: hypothetical protein FWG64_14575 [Firmicutes bacterium]|nr:hypothetical protein [Bacillota bacterium]